MKKSKFIFGFASWNLVEAHGIFKKILYIIKIMGKYASAAGRWLGEKVGGFLGEKVGGLIPFKKGGPVRRTTKALLHKGEYVLPAGVKPTAEQRRKVASKRKHKK